MCITYRGFKIGAMPIPRHAFVRPAYQAVWRSSLEGKWSVGFIQTDDFAEVPKLAREAIDFNCAMEAMAVEAGRPWPWKPGGI